MLLTFCWWPSTARSAAASMTDSQTELTAEQGFRISDLFPWSPPTHAGGMPPVPSLFGRDPLDPANRSTLERFTKTVPLGHHLLASVAGLVSAGCDAPRVVAMFAPTRPAAQARF